MPANTQPNPPIYGPPQRQGIGAAGAAPMHVAYTNFPTILIAGHTLMLRRRWPEDLHEAARDIESPLLAHFGTTGEVLTLSDAQGQTIAALWVHVHRDEPLPESGSAAWPGALSSLRTALRYTRMGWLEVGPIFTAATANEAQEGQRLSHFVAALIWQGIQRLLDRNGLGFALGLSIAPPTDADAPVTDMIPLLLEKHGLDPEFAYRPHKFTGAQAPAAIRHAEPEAFLTCDLREALRRGAKLCGEPAVNPQGQAYFFWALAKV
jgi:hypothetical protein